MIEIGTLNNSRICLDKQTRCGNIKNNDLTYFITIVCLKRDLINTYLFYFFTFS